MSVWHGLGLFVLAVGVGVGVGLALGMISAWLLCKLSDSLVEVAIFLLLPVRRVRAGRGAPWQRRPGGGVGRHPDRPEDAEDALRHQVAGRSVTATVDFVLETLVFGLIGLQLPSVLSELRGGNTARSPGW